MFELEFLVVFWGQQKENENFWKEFPDLFRLNGWIGELRLASYDWIGDSAKLNNYTSFCLQRFPKHMYLIMLTC